MLLFESILDISEIIFNNRELVKLAKNCFITANVKCHVLDVMRHNNSYNSRHHESAIKTLFANEYKKFCKVVNSYNVQINAAKVMGKEEVHRQLISKLMKGLNSGYIEADEEIKTQRINKVKNLYPYALQTNDYIACIYIDPSTSQKFRIILDTAKNLIVTAFEVTDYDIQFRAIHFTSIELLLLSIYGTLNVTPEKTYIAIEQFTHPELKADEKAALFNKFFASQGIEPQQRQQAIRQYKKELKGEV